MGRLKEVIKAKLPSNRQFGIVNKFVLQTDKNGQVCEVWYLSEKKNLFSYKELSDPVLKTIVEKLREQLRGQPLTIALVNAKINSYE